MVTPENRLTLSMGCGKRNVSVSLFHLPRSGWRPDLGIVLLLVGLTHLRHVIIHIALDQLTQPNERHRGPVVVGTNIVLFLRAELDAREHHRVKPRFQLRQEGVRLHEGECRLHARPLVIV